MDLSIIIVNYNTKDLTADAINSVEASKTNFSYEIIVVDNASSDGSIEMFKEKFPHISIHENLKNVGFSKANNLGIRNSNGRYILLLNSDTLVRKDTIDHMITIMDEKPAIGASGCKVLLPSGNLDKACKRGFPTPSSAFFYFVGLAKLFPKNAIFNQYHLGHLDPDKNHMVDSLVGAFMVVRKEAIKEVGLLDEDFFMYGEDIDWCYRLQEAGWDIYYSAETSITHFKGASSKKKPKKIIYEFHRAMYLFHKKNYNSKYNSLINFLIYSTICTKCITSLLVNQLKRSG